MVILHKSQESTSFACRVWDSISKEVSAMVVVYFVLVAVYFLLGYLFLPDRICATGWYFGGAALFPVVVFVFM